MKTGVKDFASRILYPVPTDLKQRHSALTADGVAFVRESIQKNYHTEWRSKDKYSDAAYANDLAAHLHRRIQTDRKTVVPWLNSIRQLEGAYVLEVGCGTGSSTVAFAEQGAVVTGLDIDEGALTVARDRCKAHEVRADILHGNIDGFEFPQPYDFVIFFACVEHMTHDERLNALRSVWQQMKQGAILAVVETPNRLWWLDDHTSVMPFYNWLPHELAYRYSRFSDRENFRENFLDDHCEKMEHFIRQGRGASFHEFDLAIGPNLDVISGLREYQGWRYSIRRSRRDRAFHKLLRSIRPDMHSAWFEPYLDIAIRKN